MSTPKVAATILTRNRRDLLRQSLDAVLGQTRPVDHLIVVDNESSDGTVDSVHPSDTSRVTDVPSLTLVPRWNSWWMTVSAVVPSMRT